jgi:Holliday junction resolvasome RuvABC endonuclease subunit
MVKIILGLKESPRPQHAADALAMAICAARLPVLS